jgi:hypothetical protein
MKYNIISCVPTVLCLLTSTANAHTWIENLRLIASNGSFVGDLGFPRAYLSRETNQQDSNTNLIPPNGRATGNAILSTDLMCSTSQTVGKQTTGFPRLKAAPKDRVALRYEENGHVTKFTTDPGKPLGRGTVYVYATKTPSNSDTYLGIHRVWNVNGTGGDQRGKLIATQSFDDQRCYQAGGGAVANTRAQQLGTNSNTEVLCQTDIQIPDDVGTTGMYTLYWVWEWPTLFTNGNVAKNQSYTACMDIDLVSSPVAVAGKFTAVQSGLKVDSVAIESRASTAFLVNPTALPQVAPDNMGVVQPGKAQATSLASAPLATSARASASAAPTTLKTSTKTKASASTKKATQQPSGFVTVTVNVAAVEKTVTVTMSPPAVSTVYVVTMTTATTTVTANSPAAAASTGGVFVSGSASPSAAAPASSSVTRVATSAKSTMQTLASVAAVSKPSGMYTTGTAVPTPQPFLTSASKVAAYVPVRARRY